MPDAMETTLIPNQSFYIDVESSAKLDDKGSLLKSVLDDVRDDVRDYVRAHARLICSIVVLLIIIGGAIFIFWVLPGMRYEAKPNSTATESGTSPLLPNYTNPLSNSSDRRVENTGKLTARFYNGVMMNISYFPFDLDSPSFPRDPIVALGRPLQQGGKGPIVQYVARWSRRGQPLHWGAVTSSEQGKAESSFIDENNRVYNLVNLREGDSIELPQNIGDEQSNGPRLTWMPARDADPAAVVVFLKSTNSSNSRLAPAVYQEDGYEFLGEADIDNWTMKHVFKGGVEIISEAQFANNVYLLAVASENG